MVKVMKFKDVVSQQYPDGTMTVEELLDKFVKKPEEDGSDEQRLSSTDVLKHLGAPDSYERAKRASLWFKANGFYNYGDKWCWRVAFKDIPVVPQYVI